MALNPKSILVKRKSIRYGALLALLFLLLSAGSFAQDKITVKDAKDISYEATQTVKNVPVLLNFIADPGTSPSDFSGMVNESYTPSRNRIFFSKDNTLIEDDIDPASGLGQTSDLPVDKYLNKLDAQYIKSTDATIVFDSVITSNIKKKEYIYVNVKFSSNFKGINRSTNTGYKPKQRVALVKMQLKDNKWEALIMSIDFYDPAKPLNDKLNDVDLYTDTSATATVVSQEDFAKEKDSFIQSKEEEEKNKQAIFDQYVADATTYINNKQYKEALALYDKAQKLKSFEPALDKKILDATHLEAQYTYDNFKNKGDRAKDERRYDIAIQHYQLALQLKPEASTQLNALIAPLTARLSLVAPPEAKFESGQFQLAIDACEKILHDNKKTKTDFPELYYIEARSYEGLIKEKPDDTKSLIEKASDNYDEAIKDFPNYLDARISRATFLVKYKNDYVGAISDYDVVIINALDDNPEKPGYFVTRAKLKDNVQNFTSALDDYTKALNLVKTDGSIFYDEGQLQYRLNKFDDALKNLNTSITLDPKNKNAYYYRGLTYVALRNNDAAGADFMANEKLTFEPAQLEKVTEITNNFFNEGERYLAKHDLVNADTAYNNAIKIRNCNSQAWHGKAEIRLVKAREAGKNADVARAKYQESIGLNTKAVTCNPDFSDAHYKLGMAHQHIAKYDLALKSLGEAVRSNTQNNRAYIERGNIYQILQKYDKAADDYLQAIGILKGDYELAKKGSKDSLTKAKQIELSNAQQLNGEALYNNKDYANALLILDQSIDNNQQNAEALYCRGQVHAQQTDYSKAFKDYNAAIIISQDYRYYYADGAAAYTDKNYQQAISNYSDAVNRDTLSKVKNKFYLLGMSYFKNRQANDAIADFARYEKAGVQPADSSFYGDYGLAKLYAGQDTSAMQYLNKAITIKANNFMSLYSLACGYAKAKQYDKALVYFEKALITRQLVKDDIKYPESIFLVDMLKDKPTKVKYNTLKKLYLEN